jgi:tRNA (guanine37-N1)-methyltransferase
MNIHKEVKSVWMQTSSVSGEYRLRNLEYVAGTKSTETLYKEYGCNYKIDLKKAYFSPRLSYERLRIAKLVQPKKIVVNMFSGVGCFSIAIAKHAHPQKVLSIDVNPSAFRYLEENIRINRSEKVVVPVLGDAKTLIKNELQNFADRVLMPLPEKAYDYLDVALLALKPKGGWIHYYDFEYAKRTQDPVKKVEAKVSKKLSSLSEDFEVMFGRIVRTIGPRWYQIVLDIKIGI